MLLIRNEDTSEKTTPLSSRSFARRGNQYPISYVDYVAMWFPKAKKAKREPGKSRFSFRFVGDDGFEPPTLCL